MKATSPEPPDYPFAPADIARLQRHAAPPEGVLEGTLEGALYEQTWRDLLLERYADSLSGQVSIFGRQVLYRRLRSGVGDAECPARRARIEGLLREPERLDALHLALRPLRRADVVLPGVRLRFLAMSRWI